MTEGRRATKPRGRRHIGGLRPSSISRRDWAAHFSRSGLTPAIRSKSPCQRQPHRIGAAGGRTRAEARRSATGPSDGDDPIERYLFRTAATAFLSGLVVLTGVIWITQALRQIDLLTSKGQTILIFLLMTGLALPSLIAVIAPVALFAGVLYTLNKLNGDSELVVMAAAGVSPARLLRPIALLSGLVFAIVAAIYIQVLPWSFGAIENLTTFVHADFISNFARPGAFSQLEFGFVFHYRERTPDGALRGVFMQDRRDPAHVSTYIAEAGKTVDNDGTSYLQLTKGVLLRPSRPAIRRW